MQCCHSKLQKNTKNQIQLESIFIFIEFYSEVGANVIVIALLGRTFFQSCVKRP